MQILFCSAVRPGIIFDLTPEKRIRRLDTVDAAHSGGFFKLRPAEIGHADGADLALLLEVQSLLPWYLQ